MSNSVPVTIQGLSVSNSGNGGATVLTQSQANQLLQKLRSIQTSGKQNFLLVFSLIVNYVSSENVS